MSWAEQDGRASDVSASERDESMDVIPAYLGWGNPERDKVSLRLYATDQEAATAPRWDKRFEGGRVVEYAVVERFGQAEGDRFLVVRVGDRFTSDETMQQVSEAIADLLSQVRS